MHEAAILVFGLGVSNVLLTGGAFKLKFLTNLEILTFQFKRDEFPGYQHEKMQSLATVYAKHTVTVQFYICGSKSGIPQGFL